MLSYSRLGARVHHPTGMAAVYGRMMAEPATARKSDEKAAAQAAQRLWVEALMRKTGLSASRVATNAGLADTTLSRLFDADYHGTLSTPTITRLMEYYRVPGPEEFASASARRPALGFEEAELYVYDPANDTADIPGVIEALRAGRHSVAAWRLKTRALELAGYLPGDIVVVDVNAIL
jgi:AraC-like DNA-binding protein